MNISASQYAQSWYEILSTARDKDSATHSLLQELHTAGKIKLIPEILRLMKAIELKKQGKIAVTVTTARTLPSETIQQILNATIGNRPAEVTMRTDTQAIGGAKVRTEHEQWDLTVSGQLNSMKQELLTLHS